MEAMYLQGNKLPSYRCHKRVWALRIGAIEVDAEKKVARITPADTIFLPFDSDRGWPDKYKGDASDLGYFIVYEDKHTSWSPTKAFESGYTLMAEYEK